MLVFFQNSLWLNLSINCFLLFPFLLLSSFILLSYLRLSFLSDLFLFLKPFSLCSLSLILQSFFFCYHSRIKLPCSPYKFIQSNPFFFDILLSNFVILFLHPSFFISVFCFIQVIFIMTWEVPPCLKIVPKIVKCLYLFKVSINISYLWNWLLFTPNAVSFKHRVENLVKCFFINLRFLWNAVIEWERWIKGFLFLWIWEDLIRLLDFEPNVILKLLVSLCSF